MLRDLISAIVISASMFAMQARLAAQAPNPTCVECPSTYIPKSELDAYTARALKYNLVDEQVRAVDLGHSRVGIGMVTRKHLEPGTLRKGGVAEHEQVSEVYYIIEGSGTIVTGPDLVNPVKRPPDEKTVRLQNGPGFNADSIKNAQTHNLKAGDMLIIPAGTGHLWTEIPGDHVTYMMVRIDPDKIVPTKTQAESEADLKKVPEPQTPRGKQ